MTIENTNKGVPKILSECKLPLTAMKEVLLIITRIAGISPVGDNIEVLEINPQFTFEEI